MKAYRLVRVILAPVLMVAGAGILAFVGTSAASAASGTTYTCTGGNVPAGTYGSMIITGVCYMPAGNVTVQRNLTVAPGALLDAATQGDPVGSPVVPATVVVGGNVSVGTGAVLIFGCSPNIFCSSPPGVSYDRIGGNLTGTGALGVVVHSASIQGNVSLLGGGGGVNCNSTPVTPPSTVGAPTPWSKDASLDYTPVYSDFEDVSIGGNLSIVGLQSCWLGTLRVQVRGNTSVINNTMADPDAMEIGSNLIGGNMTCSGNSAGGVSTVQFGDGGAAPSMVGGSATGQCGFNVQVLNPAAEAGPGGIPEHISVSAASLGTYSGTHTQSGPSVETLPLGVTSSGDTLSAELNNVIFGGSGLKGTLTVDTSQPWGPPVRRCSSPTTPTVLHRSPPSTTARPAASSARVAPLR